MCWWGQGGREAFVRDLSENDESRHVTVENTFDTCVTLCLNSHKIHLCLISEFSWKRGLRDLSRRLPDVILLSIIQQRVENLKAEGNETQPPSGCNFKSYNHS